MTIKQHRIPKFLLKKWGENFTYVNLVKKNIKYAYPSQATTINFFYEHESKKLNEIENKISIVESSVSRILNLLLDESKCELTPEMLSLLIKFSDIQSIRVESEENKIDIIESFHDKKMKNIYDKSKFGIVEKIDEIIKFDYPKELFSYRKWRRNLTKKNMKKLNGTFIAEYSIWSKKYIYSLQIMRHLIDINQAKIFIVENEFNENIITDRFSSGDRNSFGAVYYYSFPISPKKTLIFYLSDYGKHENNLFTEISKNSDRVSFRKNYVVKTYKITPQKNFQIQIRIMNEAREFIICHSLNHLFDFIKKSHQYKIVWGWNYKYDFNWINFFIMEKLSDKYKKETYMLKKNDWRF